MPLDGWFVTDNTFLPKDEFITFSRSGIDEILSARQHKTLTLQTKNIEFSGELSEA